MKIKFDFLYFFYNLYEMKKIKMKKEKDRIYKEK